MPYQNPIPSPTDENISRKVMVSFEFKKGVTKQEAADGINAWFKENGGTLSADDILFNGNVGMAYTEVQPQLGKYDRDPDGYGPRKCGE